MKTLTSKSPSGWAAVMLLLAALLLGGCYNPEAPKGTDPQAYTGPGPAQFPPHNTNMGPPVMPLVPGGTQGAPATGLSPLLRPNDMIIIEWFDTVNPIPQYKERIRDDGKLVLPLNIVVHAAGKTVAQLQDDIRGAYVPKFYHNLTISVKTEERVFFVGGEVRSPNRQYYHDGITVLRAIDTAGGFTDFAHRGKIELRRSNGQIIKVNWKEAMKNPKKDPVVYPDDQIIVHKRII